MRRKLIAGNWKMNGQGAQLGFFDSLRSVAANAACDVLICPPATLLSRAADLCRGSAIKLGGQDCHAAESGAHTGDVSASMLVDAGASFVVLGHSERRADHGERSESVKEKAGAALAAGLVPVICVGETREEREAGRAIEIVLEQVKASMPDDGHDRLVVAYEPVWAIGTGLVASLDDIVEMHAAIRDVLPVPDVIRVLYGGSVKPANAREILHLDNVDGALVGGASLAAESFSEIIQAVS